MWRGGSSERLLEEARDRGLTVTIIKLGFLGPSSLDGFWNTSDWLFALLTACRRVGAVYTSAGTSAHEPQLVCVPVDLAAQGIVNLCAELTTTGATYVLNEASPGGI